MANALVLLGAGSSGSGTLTPPSVAPVLTVSADNGSTIANLEWTASNKMGSAGAGYNIYRTIAAVGPTLLITVGPSTLAYDDNNSGAAGELYEYFVTPKNNAGEGPSSNTAGVILPGESNSLLLNAGGGITLNAGGLLMING